MEELLKIENLSVGIPSPAGKVQAVRDVSFELYPGEVLAIVGESGCGKSMLCKAIMKLLPKSAKIEGGKIIAGGVDITGYSDRDMRRLRGKLFSMIFQDPMTALNPLMTVGDQIAEVLLLHQTEDKKAAMDKAGDMLEMVGIPRERYVEYPHQFSGGMKQRVVIAIALACNPKMLIADEPTTALDVTIQAQVLDLMRELQKDMGTSIAFITHDLGVVSEMCDRVIVLYCGEVVEEAMSEELFANPQHPYTEGLLGTLPKFGQKGRLATIPGVVPPSGKFPPGCVFAPRCPYATEKCHACKPALCEISDGHKVRCFRYNDQEQEVK